MSDDADHAQRLAEREIAAGVARVRQRLAGSAGRLVCDCGEPISAARRKAAPNTDQCANCATFPEAETRLMDLTQLLAWIVAANTIINFATSAYTLMSARATKALEGIKEIGKRIDGIAEDRKTLGDAINARFQLVESRLLKIEADMEHMPDRDQAHRLEMAIEKLTGRMETLDERMTGRMDTLDERLKPVAATSARIQNYLMEKGAEA